MPLEEQTYRDGVLHKLNDIQEDVTGILVQTKLTNGRVNKLEKDAAVFKARAYTAVSILTFIVGSMIIPLLGSWIQSGTIHL